MVLPTGKEDAMSDLTNRLQRAHRTQTGFLDVVAEVGELEARLRAVQSAFSNPGPMPRYHGRMKDKLACDWPALHHALTQACKP